MFIHRVLARFSAFSLTACLALCASLAHAVDPCLLGPEGSICPSSSKNDPAVKCDSCCPTTPKTDYTCENATVKAYVAANLSQCVSCDAILGAAEKCMPADACSKTCPPGQDLINPELKNCYCQKHDEFCKDIGDVQALSVRTFHPKFQIADQSWDAFQRWDTTQKKMVTISSETALNGVSPCMNQVRKNCAEKFVGGYGFGFSSYRSPGNQSDLSAQDKDNFATWVKDIRKRQTPVAGVPTPTDEQLFDVHIAPPLAYLDSCIKASLTQGQELGAWSKENEYTAGNITVRNTTVYLQSDCRPVERWKQKLIQTCDVPITAYFNTYTSPVSLLWGEDTKIKDIFSRSKFPLNPKEAGKWFVWKASGKTPLVVWDPEGTGIILSAKQLFGNHTFEKEWKNGYEPLGSLDKDHNDWLEGEELKGIALWFDFNQDGISNTGEVKKPSDVGVFAIGTKSSQDDLKNGNIFADKGYKRKVGDKVIEGRSVDWFSASVEGRFGMEALYGGSSEGNDAGSAENARKAINPSKDVAGIWDWRMVDFSKQELPENMPRGSFTLLVDDNGISGTSYVMQETAPNKSGIGEQLIASQITGSLSNVAGKNPGVIFTSVTPNGGKVESKAVLSDDGSLLYGETREESGPNRDPIRYGWVARRFSGY